MSTTTVQIYAWLLASLTLAFVASAVVSLVRDEKTSDVVKSLREAGLEREDSSFYVAMAAIVANTLVAIVFAIHFLATL